MAVRPDPAEIFAVFEADAAAGPDARRHAIHRHHAAPGHHLGEARLVGAEMLRADRRADAVGADDDVAFGVAAVGKARHRRIVDVSAPMQLAPSCSGMSPIAAAAGYADRRGARSYKARRIFRARSPSTAREGAAAASSHLSDTMLVGSNALRMQLVLEAERAQHLDAVRPDLQAGADFFELGASAHRARLRSRAGAAPPPRRARRCRRR